MKIYFAGSIRGGRDDQEIYFDIIKDLGEYGQVLTEHIGRSTLTGAGENHKEDYIFTRDMEWVKEADAIVAEVTQPSLGVGYELGQAESMQKPILCLYRNVEGKKLSAMILGNKYFQIFPYEKLEDAREVIKNFFKSIKV